MDITRVLIANRGEIAIRIARAAAGLGMESVAVYPAIDETALHTRYADIKAPIPGNAVDAYLNLDALIAVAKEHNCDCIHPGYGFVSENAELAARCADAGITFVGPSSDVLTLFGNKVSARELALSLDIPVVPGSPEALPDAATAHKEATRIGFPVMLKAAGGGGGRGMRMVPDADSLDEAFDRCSSEAEAAFGDGTVFMEKFVVRPRHIEIQILSDGNGNTVHLFERDCSVQLRNQKVIEIAPAPDLDSTILDQLYADAVKLASSSGYANEGTVEFLVMPETGEYFFIECNPRIQVEHTVTESVTGVDLVEAQFAIAGGATLADLGLADQTQLSTRGFAIQARVVAQGTGTISAYKEPAGPGVRVDAAGYAGYAPPPQFDPLLGKVIGMSNSSRSFASAINKTLAALNDFQINGLPTNLNQLRLILNSETLRSGDARTTLLLEEPDLMNALAETSEPLALLEQTARTMGSASPVSATTSGFENEGLAVGADEWGAECPMAGTVVEVTLEAGAEVSIGDTLVVISAMKMETEVTAPCSGVLRDIMPLSSGDSVGAGQIVATIAPSADAKDEAELSDEHSWAPLLEETKILQALAKERLAPGSEDPGVVRQRSRGKLTCRERIELLLDQHTFKEVGSLAGFASYDEDGVIDAFTPANHIGGYGRIDKRPVIVCADDFTSRGGHADGAIGAKSGHLDRLSTELRIPSIRLLDGSSGGGSVAAMVPKQKTEGESNAKESSGAIKAGRPRVAGGGGSYLPGHLGSNSFTTQLSTVPVVNMLLGSVVGIGAAKAVLGHFSVMVRDVSQLFVAGPPVVSHAMGYDITKEDLGGWHIHCTNGSVDNLAESEEEAAHMTRQFLSYLPTSVFEAPPVMDCSDAVDRSEDELFSIIPRKRTTTFDIRRTISLMADKNSFFEIGKLWGSDQVTGFVRFNGHPVGVIASDSRHENGGALTADGCDKLKRHLDLCDLFHIPVLNLVDNPGFAVGLEHEIRSTIRKGGEWMVAFAQVTIPVFTVIMRRSFGVAGNNYATPRSAPSTRVVWPAADVGGIPPEGGIEAAYKRQLAEAEDPVALRAELEARIESARGPIGPLNRFQMEEMIDPRETRRHICDWIELAYRIVRQPSRLQSRALQFRP